MHVDIWKVHTCDSHWTLSQRCSPHLGLGKVDCVFPFLKMWKSPPLVTCDSLRECVEIHSFFGVSSVWKVFGVSLRMFGHFSNMAACISSMECIDSSMEFVGTSFVCLALVSRTTGTSRNRPDQSGLPKIRTQVQALRTLRLPSWYHLC